MQTLWYLCCGQKLATVADLAQAVAHSDASTVIGLKRDGRPLQVAAAP